MRRHRPPPPANAKEILQRIFGEREALLRFLKGKQKAELLAILTRYKRIHGLTARASATDIKYAILDAVHPLPSWSDDVDLGQVHADRRVPKTVRSWGSMKPFSAADRARVLARCGPSAFLAPEGTPLQARPHPSFPVVARQDPTCAVSCVGADSARRRATILEVQSRGTPHHAFFLRLRRLAEALARAPGRTCAKP